ncbi:MAG: Ribosomal RNA small subunit methyltransferase I [Legionellaceae bacterium]
MKKIGHLYIVATPIGNLQDITVRAIDILKHVDCIAAEDTRHSKILLSHYQINTPLISFHAHNEQQRAQALLSQLKEGKNIALISDAGTPLISDPGYEMVRLALAEEIRVIPIPGPCALITGLSASGLPTDRFAYEGFLPAKSSTRKQYLNLLQDENRTLVFYEAPHRIIETLQDMAVVFSLSRHATIARELTKTYETIYSATLEEIIARLIADKQQQKGEFVILIQGIKKENLSAFSESERILKILLAELPVKQATNLTSQITGEKKNTLYTLALAMKEEDNK